MAAMSALDGWIDVSRTGIWRDLSGRAVTPATAVIGHPGEDAPAWAWVDWMRRAG